MLSRNYTMNGIVTHETKHKSLKAKKMSFRLEMEHKDSPHFLAWLFMKKSQNHKNHTIVKRLVLLNIIFLEVINFPSMFKIIVFIFLN